MRHSLVTRVAAIAAVLVLCATPAAPDTVVVDKGNVKHSEAVDCGALIAVREDVHYRDGEADYPKGISITCKSDSPDKCCWLQFVSRTLVVRFKDQTKKDEYIAGPLDMSSGHYELTTKPSSPKWHVDSGGFSKGGADPGTRACYQDSGTYTHDKETLTIYDQPGSIIDLKAGNRKNDAGVESIVSEAHYQSYLICDKNVCGMVEWTATYTWTPGPNGGSTKGPEYVIGKPLKKDKLEDDQKTVLNKEYKDQKIL